MKVESLEDQVASEIMVVYGMNKNNVHNPKEPYSYWVNQFWRGKLD